MKIYLAIPYTALPEVSFEVANIISARLMNTHGHIVFSPISHTHPIALAGSLPTGWDYWKKFDETFIEWAEALYVVHINSHKGIDYEASELVRASHGVTGEIGIANNLGKPVHIVHYTDQAGQKLIDVKPVITFEKEYWL